MFLRVQSNSRPLKPISVASKTAGCKQADRSVSTTLLPAPTTYRCVLTSAYCLSLLLLSLHSYVLVYDMMLKKGRRRASQRRCMLFGSERFCSGNAAIPGKYKRGRVATSCILLVKAMRKEIEVLKF